MCCKKISNCLFSNSIYRFNSYRFICSIRLNLLPYFFFWNAWSGRLSHTYFFDFFGWHQQNTPELFTLAALWKPKWKINRIQATKFKQGRLVCGQCESTMWLSHLFIEILLICCRIAIFTELNKVKITYFIFILWNTNQIKWNNTSNNRSTWNRTMHQDNN